MSPRVEQQAIQVQPIRLSNQVDSTTEYEAIRINRCGETVPISNVERTDVMGCFRKYK